MKEKMKKFAQIVSIIMTVGIILYALVHAGIFIFLIFKIRRVDLLIYLFLIMAGNFVLILLIALFVKGIAKSVACGETPFVSDNVRRLRGIAVVTLISAFIPTYGYEFIGGVLNFNFLRFDIATMTISLCVFAVAYVFAYGCKLQKNDDETL